MKKYLNYYNSDSQYTLSENQPSISYCAEEDHIHYSKIPVIGTLQEFLETYNVNNPEQIKLSASYSDEQKARMYSVGCLVNQFEIKSIYYLATVYNYYEETFNFNKIILGDNIFEYPSFIITKDILKQLDGKATIKLFPSGD